MLILAYNNYIFFLIRSVESYYNVMLIQILLMHYTITEK
jgi:hypothetical protein